MSKNPLFSLLIFCTLIVSPRVFAQEQHTAKIEGGAENTQSMGFSDLQALSQVDRAPGLESGDSLAGDLTLAKRRKKRRKPKKVAPEAAPAVAWYFLPLGIPQVMNDNMLFGGIFGALQVGGLAYMYINWSAANAKVEEINTYIDQRNAEIETLATNEEKQAHEEETKATVKSMDDESNALLASSDIGLYLLAAAWIGSTAEAFISGPPKAKDTRKKRKKKRRRKKRRFSGLGHEEEAASLARIEPSFRWQVAPLVNPIAPRQIANPRHGGENEL